MTAKENNTRQIQNQQFPEYGKASILAPLIIGGAVVAGSVMMWQTHNRNEQMAKMSRIEEEIRTELRSAYGSLRSLEPEETLNKTEKANTLFKSLNAKLAPDYASLKIYLLLVEAEALFMKDCAKHADQAEIKFDQAMHLMSYASGDLWLFGMLGRARTRYEQGKFEEALADLDTVMDRNPSFGAGYYWRSLTKDRLGDHDGAKRDEKKARSLDSWPPLRDYIQPSCQWTRDIIHKPKESGYSAGDADGQNPGLFVQEETVLPPIFMFGEADDE